ncbi:hypothetical protein EDB81DRAFT_810448 [Dactylonectria macrodidyma]|uniref:Zn(2)-C6 fungal-type domain-containing protein n=1 Tax=Dactylonectria macrodidyma TaxID=307937 RepID=A0A9P9DVR1_9HYPO|nr:hypothetical protein EDB81DRAFT_810448 [Dactylonectria macrodidyma]
MSSAVPSTPSTSGEPIGTNRVALKPRKPYSRSRTGCLTCRQKHLKCDENRPVCANCVSAERRCEFPPLGLPLRERRKKLLPGEQQPWTPPSTSKMLAVVSCEVDPFHCLPGRMPFRSTELFHYFCTSEDLRGDTFAQKRQDCLSRAIQSPDTLRSSLLIAGLHYAWNSGQLQNFESTFLFHKVEAMRLVNVWLGNLQPKAATSCIREISTLAFAECGMGDLTTSETHLDGLVRFMDIYKPLTLHGRLHVSIEDELANRYFILTYSFVHGVKSRLKDILDSVKPLGPGVKPDPAQVEFLMHKWHKEEIGGLDARLKAMRLFPAFFSPPPPETMFQDVDGSRKIECLRRLTMMTALRQEGYSISVDGSRERLDQIWVDGAATRLLLAFVNSHVESMSSDGKPDGGSQTSPRMMVSWLGISSATCLYLHAVLGIWNAGQPLETRLHRRVLLILKQDLDRVDYMAEPSPSLGPDLWFWRAFVGALSLAKSPKSAQEMAASLTPHYEDYIGRWIRKTGVTRWIEAKERLALIVWPSSMQDEGLAEQIWDSAVWRTGT